MPMNVLNVDLDDKGDPTWIEFDIDMNTLRKCVFDFRINLFSKEKPRQKINYTRKYGIIVNYD